MSERAKEGGEGGVLIEPRTRQSGGAGSVLWCAMLCVLFSMSSRCEGKASKRRSVDAGAGPLSDAIDRARVMPDRIAGRRGGDGHASRAGADRALG